MSRSTPKKNVAVLYLADAQRAAELAARLADDDIDSVVATSSEDFYGIVHHRHCDLVVVDQQLHGFLTGLEILQRMYDDVLHPATVLVAPPDFEMPKDGRIPGTFRIVSSREGLEVLEAELKRMLATSQLCQVAIPTQARRLVTACDTIRPMPQVLTKLCGYLDEETLSVKELARDISVDPRITADLLKLTNSSSHGLCRKITNVSDSIALLGIRRTLSLIVSSGVVSVQTGLLRQRSERLQRWYHQRSVLIASAASTFAQQLEHISPDTAHVLGLLQDIGILVLAQVHGRRYEHLISRVQELSQARLEVMEPQEFQTTHAEVSAALMQKWELPENLVSIVLHHHDAMPTAEQGDGTTQDMERRFLNTMQIGEAVANVADVGKPQRHQLLHRLLEPYGPAKESLCRACLGEAIKKTVESSKLFSLPPPNRGIVSRLIHTIEQPDFGNSGTDSDGQLPEFSPDGCEPVPLRPHGNAEEIGAPGRRVLLVGTFQQVAPLRSALESEGYLARFASVRDAAGEKWAVEAIVCDLDADIEQSLRLIQRLRADSHDRPIIAVSENRFRETVVRAISAGVSDYLIKPFAPALLLAKLATHISRRRFAVHSDGSSFVLSRHAAAHDEIVSAGDCDETN